MRNKILRVLLIILSVIGIVVGGFTMHEHQEKQKMIKIVTSKEAKKVYENYLKKEDPNAFTEKGFVHSYKVDKKSLDYNPMGGLMVTLIINKNKEMDVGFNLIDNEDGIYHSANYSSSRLFWKTQEKYYGKAD